MLWSMPTLFKNMLLETAKNTINDMKYFVKKYEWISMEKESMSTDFFFFYCRLLCVGQEGKDLVSSILFLMIHIVELLSFNSFILPVYKKRGMTRKK